MGRPLFTPLIIFLVQMPRNGITELKAIPNAKVFDIIYHIALHKIIKIVFTPALYKTLGNDLHLNVPSLHFWAHQWTGRWIRILAG